MNRVFKALALPFLMMVSTSCYSTQADVRVSAIEQDPLVAQERCVQEWRDVLAEWEADGGNATTLQGVRMQLKKAQTLRIAKLVRQAWKLQGSKPLRWTGQWPIDNEIRKRVNSTIDAAAEGVVSVECQQTGVFILPPLLGEEVVSGRTESPLHNLDVSAVDANRGDTTRIGQWIFFWLLAGER